MFCLLCAIVSLSCPVMLSVLLLHLLLFLLSCSDCCPSVLSVVCPSCHVLSVACPVVTSAIVPLSCHVLSVIVSLLTCCGLWSFFLLLFVCVDSLSPCCKILSCVYLSDVASLSRCGFSCCCSLCSCVSA